MYRTLLITLALSLNFVSVSAAQLQDIIQVGPGTLLNALGAPGEQQVQIRGQWVPDAEFPEPRIPQSNAVTIKCLRAAMICTEAQAVFDRTGSEGFMREHLAGYLFTYNISSWTDDAIFSQSPGGHVALRIEPRKGVVELDYTEDPGSVFSPLNQKYHIAIESRYDAPASLVSGTLR